MSSPTTAGPRPGGFSIAPEWEGETVFIIGGGPSVAGQDVELLQGRKVIAVNSSYGIAPWADILFFADFRWWNVHRKAVAGFQGRVFTTADDVSAANVLHLRKRNPPGLARDRSELTVLKTGMTAALNLAAHIGASRIVTLGLDGGPSPDGRTHHHEPHDWGQIEANWKLQRDELATIAGPLRDLGIEIVNASPGSRIPFWPIVNLKDVI